MALFRTPVTVSDLTTLQSGIEFFTNVADATAEVAAINPDATDTVFNYASRLIQNNISLSQVAMAVSALMEGGTIAVGSDTTPNTLTMFSTVFLPGQVVVATANNFNPTVFAAESLGSALSTQASFNANFVGLSVSQFAQSASSLTGVNVSAIQQFVFNWQAFFTANPAALQGRTVAQASYGSAFGDAVGVALLNPTSAALQTIVSTESTANPFIPLPDLPNIIAGLVANALIDVATGQYTTGVTLGALPKHTNLQGEANSAFGFGLFLTPGIDTPTSGFSLTPFSPFALNGFTATNANAVFQAQGNAVNTLNSGDNLQDTVGDGTLDLQDVGLAIGANPPFATNVTMNGIKTVNIFNQVARPGGFQGNIVGLQVENNNNSVAPVTIGGTGQGLNSLLTNININGYGGAAGDDINTAVLATALGDATKTINVAFTGGNLGTTKLNGAQKFAISNDTGGGTAAAPNLTYGTWALTLNNDANLQLEQSVTTDGTGAVTAKGGVGGATTLVLNGKGHIAVGQDVAGDWQKLTTIDASGVTSTGDQAVVITGNATTFATNLSSPAFILDPSGLRGSAAGLLTGNTSLTKFVGSKTGQNLLDVSSFTKDAQLAALTATGNTAVNNNVIFAASALVDTTSASTWAGINDFQAIADVGASGIINMANLPTSVALIRYQSAAVGAVTINNQTAPLTVDSASNGFGNALTVKGPAGLSDQFALRIGNQNTGEGGSVGKVTITGDELVLINSQGGSASGFQPSITNLLGLVSLSPTPGGTEQVTIAGGGVTTQFGITNPSYSRQLGN